MIDIQEAMRRADDNQIADAIDRLRETIERAAKLQAAAIIAASNREPGKDGVFATSWVNDAWNATATDSHDA